MYSTEIMNKVKTYGYHIINWYKWLERIGNCIYEIEEVVKGKDVWVKRLIATVE